MTDCYLISTSGFEVGGIELVDRWRAMENRPLLWIDSDRSDDVQDQRFLDELFAASEFIAKDFLHHRRPPKFNAEPASNLLLLRGLNALTHDLEFGTIQLGLVWNSRVLMTRRTGESRSIMATVEKLKGKWRPASSTELVLTIFTTLGERFLPIILALEERLEELEDSIFEQPDDTQLEELVGYQTALKRLRRITAYHQAAIAHMLSSDTLALKGNVKRMAQECSELLERLASLKQLFYELCGDLVDGYLSLAAHRLNEIMKVLTIVTAIFVPLGLIAGIYGMNFQVMPELQWEYGYFAVLGFMATTAIVLLTVFRAKKWV